MLMANGVLFSDYCIPRKIFRSPSDSLSLINHNYLHPSSPGDQPRKGDRGLRF